MISIFLRKEIALPVQKTAERRFFVGDGCVAAENFRNFSFADDKIQTTKRLEKISDAVGVVAAVETSWGVVCCSEYGVYLESEQVSSTVFPNPAMLFCPKQNLLVISQTGMGTWVFDGADCRKVCDFGSDTLAFCTEKVFGVSENKLVFTDTDDFDQWNTVDLAERVSAVVSAGERLWLLGNSIYRVEVDHNEPDVKISLVAKGTETVAPKSAAYFNGKVVFATKSGVYGFSAGKVKRLFSADFVENSKLFATVCSGRYFLAFRDGFADGLLEMDENFEVFAIHRASATFLSGTERLIVCQNGQICAFSTNFAHGVAESSLCDFGNAFATKYLKRLCIQTPTGASVCLTTEKDRRIFHFGGSADPQSIGIFGAFDKLKVEIFADGQAEVNYLSVVASLPKEVAYEYSRQ